jgi:hypothetical protein
LLKKDERPKWAIHFPPPDERLLSLTPLEFKLIRPIIPLVYVYELPHSEGQAATAGGSASWINDAAKVASRLPRSLEETNSLWIRNAAPSPGRLGSVEKVNVARLRKVLDLVKDEPAWRGIEVDDEALAALEQTNPEGTVVVDPGEDEEAENDAATKPARKPTLMSPDAKHVFMEMPDSMGPSTSELIHPVEDFQPAFGRANMVNEKDLGRSYWVSICCCCWSAAFYVSASSHSIYVCVCGVVGRCVRFHGTSQAKEASKTQETT